MRFTGYIKVFVVDADPGVPMVVLVRNQSTWGTQSYSKWWPQTLRVTADLICRRSGWNPGCTGKSPDHYTLSQLDSKFQQLYVSLSRTHTHHIGGLVNKNESGKSCVIALNVQNICAPPLSTMYGRHFLAFPSKGWPLLSWNE